MWEYFRKLFERETKCESCREGLDGTNGKCYSPCGCDPSRQLNPAPPGDE